MTLPTTSSTADRPTYVPTSDATARDRAAAAAPTTSHGDPLPLVSPRVAALAIALLALLASFTSLRNGYAFDDVAVIVKNARVHSLDGWWLFFRQAYWPPPIIGGLYRPLVILLDAILWKVGGGAPWPFHVTSVALYVATALAVYRLTKLILPARGAWVAAALFAVHPVHVECVGNVVGQSELIAGLAIALATASYIRARRSGDAIAPRTVLAICALYVVGSLAKEHAFFLPALLAISEIFAVADARPWRARLHTVAPLTVVLGVLAAGYLVARGTVPDVIKGQSFTATLGSYPWSVRLYTFFEVVPEWVRLLFWPAHLSVDYSPQMTLVPLEWTSGQYAGLAIVLFVLVAMVVGFRHSRPAGFAFAWLAVTLAIPSGLLVATGYLLAERVFFTPSIGAMVLVGVAVEWALRRPWSDPRAARLARVAVTAGLAAVLVAGTVESAFRQLIWKSNDTVFPQAVVDAPLSYRAHYSMGGYYLEHGRFAAAERELRMAIRLFPVDPEPMELLAAQYAANRMWDPAIPLLRTATSIRQRAAHATTGMKRYPRTLLINVYIEKAQYDSAAAVAGRALLVDPSDSAAARLLRIADSARATGRGLPARP